MRIVRTDGKKILFGVFVMLFSLSFATVNMRRKRTRYKSKNCFTDLPKITITKDASGNVVFSPHSTSAYEVKLFSTYMEAAKYLEKISVERKLTPVPLILTVNLSSATKYPS